MSVGRLSLSSTSSTMSGFRQLASVGRLGRKSRPASIISSSSSVDSASQSSCVNRDTSSDDCGLHRFVVWAAVRRNLSARISDDERRECPLIKCAQRFPDHERMLQHLYRCEHLPSGQYFCHECSRIERFSDAKCRRCLNGNPSRRRKIISKAKGFFSSLGNGNKNNNTNSKGGGGVDAMILEHGGMLDFGSFVDEPLMGQSELPSDANEIFEIDSNEVGLGGSGGGAGGGHAVPPPSSSSAQAMVQTLAPPLPPPPLPLPLPPPFSPGLDNGTQLLLTQWEAQNHHQQHRHVYGLPFGHQAYGTSPDGRCCAQAAMDPTRMSSVRSNASTGSTTSNISNFSTWSNVSGVSTVTNASTVSTVPTLATPASPWCDATAWASPSKATTATSGSMPLSPAQLLSPVDSVYMDAYTARDAGARGDMLPIPELPAEPVPADPLLDSKLPADLAQLMGSLPASLPAHSHSHSESQSQSQSPLEPTIEPLPSAASLPLPPVAVDTHMDGLGAAPSTTANALLELAWEVLRDHITSSLATLRKEPTNPLAAQLYHMSPETLALTGLLTLRSMLETDKSPEPVDALCFAHVAFALSFSLDDRHTDVRVIDLYRQVLVYGQRYAPHIREAYVQLAKAIWEPSNMHCDMSGSLSETPGPSSLSLPASPLSSNPAGNAGFAEYAVEPAPARDRLISTARYFLDRLDHAVVKDMGLHSAKPSSLASRHLVESAVTLSNDVLDEFGRLMTALCRQYSDNLALVAAIRATLQPNSHSSVRRVELELLEAGRIHLPWRTFFEAFVPLIHDQFTCLYGEHPAGHSARSRYHSQAIELVASIDPCLDEAWRKHHQRQEEEEEEEEEEEVNEMDSMMMGLGGPMAGGVDWTAMLNPGILSDQLFRDFTTTMDQSGDESESDSDSPVSSCPPADVLSTPKQDQGVVTPPSPEPTPQQAVEADDSCELCDYRPKGDPRWFKGSMAKHMKNQHGNETKIHKCPYPGCTSQYKNRPDNLRAHMIEKKHFVDAEPGQRRPHKRRRVEG